MSKHIEYPRIDDGDPIEEKTSKLGWVVAQWMQRRVSFNAAFNNANAAYGSRFSGLRSSVARSDQVLSVASRRKGKQLLLF